MSASSAGRVKDIHHADGEISSAVGVSHIETYKSILSSLQAYFRSKPWPSEKYTYSPLKGESKMRLLYLNGSLHNAKNVLSPGEDEYEWLLNVWTTLHGEEYRENAVQAYRDAALTELNRLCLENTGVDPRYGSGESTKASIGDELIDSAEYKEHSEELETSEQSGIVEETEKIDSTGERLPESVSPDQNLYTQEPSQSSPDPPLTGEWELKEVDISSPLRYEALSYSWMARDGDADRIWPIALKGGQVVYVTRNLWQALHRLCPKSGFRVVWADQICINQEDVGERQQQMKIMKDVFQRAMATILWLGEEDETTRQIATFMGKVDTYKNFIESKSEESKQNSQRISRALQMQILEQVQDGRLTTEYTEDLLNLETTDPDLEPAAGRALGAVRREKLKMRGRDSNTEYALAAEIHGRDKNLVGPGSPARSAFVKLFRRPWFHRLWILQEVVLSRHLRVVCGSLCFEWDDLVTATAVLESFDEYKQLATLGRDTFLEYSKSRSRFLEGSTFDLLSLLLGPARLLNCSEPRDRLYALFGIASSPQQMSSTVDYSLPMEAVYLRAAIDIIRNTKSLQIFSGVQEAVDSSKLPSWVPDWRFNLNYPPLDLPQHPKFSASVGRQHVFEDSEKPGSLRVRGRVIDIIEGVLNHPFEQLYDTKAPVQELLPLNEIFDTLCEYHDDLFINPDDKWNPVVRHHMMSILLRTVGGDGLLRTANVEQSISLPFSDQTISFMIDACLDTPVQQEPTIERTLLAAELREYTLENMRRMLALCRFRRLVIPLHTCFVALAPRHARETDVIAILHGSNVPCVLRCVEEGKYIFIGQCYVHGIMDGEAVDWDTDEADAFLLV